MTDAHDPHAPAASPGPVLAFDRVVFRRGPSTVLDGVSLTVGRGETVALVGRSGSGKTTLLRLANALLLPNEGEVRVEDRPTTSWDPISLRRRTGYMLQEGGLFPHFTVARNIGLLPALEGWPKGRIAERVSALLDLVGLPASLADRLPAQLSGGQRQRVGVARALAIEPPLLLCDEPFGALDPLTRATLQRELVALQRSLSERGTPTSVLLVTHDLREALVVGDRVALLDGGRIEVLATPAEFLRTTHPLARTFLDTLDATPKRAFTRAGAAP
jgi:osmoprotectant transport system ATP-binding protein